MSTPNLPVVGSNAGAMALPSGRTLNVSAGPEGEQIEVRGLNGAVEVRITLTEAGPVLSLSGAKLEINSSESIALNCKALSINTSESLSMTSEGSVDVRARGDIRAKSLGNTDIDAQVVNLNCGDRSEYNDDALPRFEVPVAEVPPAEGGDCGCGHAH